MSWYISSATLQLGDPGFGHTCPGGWFFVSFWWHDLWIGIYQPKIIVPVFSVKKQLRRGGGKMWIYFLKCLGGTFFWANKTNWCATWPSSRIYYSETAEFFVIGTPLFIQCLGLDSPSFRVENPQNPSDIEYGVPLQIVNGNSKKNKATKQSPPSTMVSPHLNMDVPGWHTWRSVLVVVVQW